MYSCPKFYFQRWFVCSETKGDMSSETDREGETVGGRASQESPQQRQGHSSFYAT